MSAENGSNDRHGTAPEKAPGKDSLSPATGSAEKAESTESTGMDRRTFVRLIAAAP